MKLVDKLYLSKFHGNIYMNISFNDFSFERRKLKKNKSDILSIENKPLKNFSFEEKNGAIIIHDPRGFCFDMSLSDFLDFCKTVNITNLKVNEELIFVEKSEHNFILMSINDPRYIELLEEKEKLKNLTVVGEIYEYKKEAHRYIGEFHVKEDMFFIGIKHVYVDSSSNFVYLNPLKTKKTGKLEDVSSFISEFEKNILKPSDSILTLITKKNIERGYRYYYFLIEPPFAKDYRFINHKKYAKEYGGQYCSGLIWFQNLSSAISIDEFLSYKPFIMEEI